MGRQKARKSGRLAIQKRASPGASPGTLVAEPGASRPRIRVFAYGPGQVEEHALERPEEIRRWLGKVPVTWVDVDGLGDPSVVEQLGRVLGLHPLALEDAVNVYQRPKVDEYPGNLFVVVRMATRAERLHTEQLALFLGENFVVTFQGDHPGDCLDPVRKRLRQEHGRIRSSGPDYLAYALIDAVIDNYFPVLDEFGEELERLEDDLVAAPVPGALSRIQGAKQDLLVLRRTLTPLRDVMTSLARDDSALVRSETRVYLRDCVDHTAQLMDVVSTYRELAGDLIELYLSGVNYRMNEVMKVLTLVSTLFIPLTFIVGVYGMNFDPSRSPWNMPEVEWRYGYPAVMGVMALIAAASLLYFRRKGWFAPIR